MSLFLAMIFGGLGTTFGRLGVQIKASASSPPPGGSTPTYYILGF